MNLGFFQGYDGLVWFVVVWNAFSGIIVAMVLKYADNILKCFASAMSIILTCFVSFLSGEFYPDLLFGIGTFLVITSSMAYGGGIPMDTCGKFQQEQASRSFKFKCIISTCVLLTMSMILIMCFNSGDVTLLLLPSRSIVWVAHTGSIECVNTWVKWPGVMTKVYLKFTPHKSILCSHLSDGLYKAHFVRRVLEPAYSLTYRVIVVDWHVSAVWHDD